MKSKASIVFVLLLASLSCVSVALAQTPDPPESIIPLNPAVGKWFSPESNLGGITLDLNFDADRPVVFGEWQFQDEGVAKVVFYQTELEYSTHDEFLRNRIYASFESPTFSFSGRGDYSDPVYGGGGQAELTGRSIRIEFHSSREATFIDNPGQPDERRFPIVSTLRGLPLVAPADYSGDWLFAGRMQIGDSPPIHTVVKLMLTPYALGTVIGNFGYLGDIGPEFPETGARVYAVECADLAPADALDTCAQWHGFASGCVRGLSFGEGGCLDVAQTLLWVNPNEIGSLANVSIEAPGVTYFHVSVITHAKIFAETDRIVLKAWQGPPIFFTTESREGYLARIPDGMLDAGSR